MSQLSSQATGRMHQLMSEVQKPTAVGRIILACLILLGLSLVGASIARYGLPAQYLGAFVALSLLVSSALLYKIVVPNGDAQYSLGNIFRYAGLFLMPLSWALLLCYARLPVDFYLRRKNKARSQYVAPVMNATIPCILSYVAYRILEHYGARPPRSADGYWTFGFVVVGFEVSTILLVYMFASIYGRRTWRSIGMMVKPEGFVIDLLQAGCGLLLAVWWSASPVVLPLAILLSISFYRVVKLAHDATEFSLEPKTRLFNARYLERHLAFAIDRSIRRGRPTSLIFADLDHLREINSAYGHLIGDLALQAVASVLRQAPGNGPIASRFGGEEFLLLLPDVAKDDAIRLAEQLRAALEAHTCTLPSGDVLNVTMSLGVATCPSDGRTNYDLIRAADHAMYRAKAAGRNKVCWAAEPVQPGS